MGHKLREEQSEEGNRLLARLRGWDKLSEEEPPALDACPTAPQRHSEARTSCAAPSRVRPAALLLPPPPLVLQPAPSPRACSAASLTEDW